MGEGRPVGRWHRWLWHTGWIRIERCPPSLFLAARTVVGYRTRADATRRRKACITVPCPTFIDTRMEPL